MSYKNVLYFSDHDIIINQNALETLKRNCTRMTEVLQCHETYSIFVVDAYLIDKWLAHKLVWPCKTIMV